MPVRHYWLAPGVPSRHHAAGSMDGLGSLLSPEAGVTRDELRESSDDGACLLEASRPRRNAVDTGTHIRRGVVTQASAAQLYAVCCVTVCSSHVRVVENLWCGRTVARRQAKCGQPMKHTPFTATTTPV